jgi:digeranylgeranylglycerophospholipid reductase
MKKCDVLIVGAGPAGASAAFFLKTLDQDDRMNVTLVEKLEGDKYQRYHRICGEGVSKEAFKELFPIKPHAIIEKISVVKDIYPGGVEFEIEMEGYLLNRSQFLDKVIGDFQKLGGNFLHENVIGISRFEKKPIIDFTHHRKEFDYVIAADGANSMIRKKTRLKEGTKKAFVQCIVEGETEHNKIIFIYDQKYKGEYKWIFPNKKSTKIGFPYSKYTNIGEEVDGRTVLEKQTRVIGYGGMKDYCVGKILFAGDAAFQTNPLTKGGIRSGMVAGRYAAEAVLQNEPEEYNKRWKKSNYDARVYMSVFGKLEKMRNKELTSMARAIDGLEQGKHKKFLEVFELCHKHGW